MIIAHVMTSTGRPWDELEDTLTVPRIEALAKYWRQSPPTHQIAAAYANYKPPKESPSLPATDASVRIGQNILAGIDAVRKPAPVVTDGSLMGMFPSGAIRL